MKLSSWLIMTILLASCAQLHRGKYAKQVGERKNTEEKKEYTNFDPYSQGNGRNNHRNAITTDLGLLVSADLDSELSSKYFGMVNFVFENTTDKWIRIDKVYINFGNDVLNENVKFVSGNQVRYYFDAINELIRIKRANQQAFATAMAGVAAGVAASSKNSYSSTNLATGYALGIATSISIADFQKTDAKTDKLFPDGHLLHKDFVIPPGVFSKKWILFNTSNHEKIGFIDNVYLTYVTSEGKKEKILVNLRSQQSDWQDDVKWGHPQYGSEAWKEKQAKNELESNDKKKKYGGY